MATKNYPRKIKPDYYKKAILRQCVVVDFVENDYLNGQFTIMVNWCISNFGSMMALHPLKQCQNGWFLNDGGIWCWVTGASVLDMGYGKIVFWFKNKEDRMLFDLTWNHSD